MLYYVSKFIMFTKFIILCLRSIRTVNTRLLVTEKNFMPVKQILSVVT